PEHLHLRAGRLRAMAQPRIGPPPGARQPVGQHLLLGLLRLLALARTAGRPARTRRPRGRPAPGSSRGISPPARPAPWPAIGPGAVYLWVARASHKPEAPASESLGFTRWRFGLVWGGRCRTTRHPSVNRFTAGPPRSASDRRVGGP